MSALYDLELFDTLQAAALARGVDVRGAEAPVIPLLARGHCVYCGAWTRGLACASHRDLLALDPNMLGRRGAA